MTIEFPAYEPQIKTIDQKPQIWCLVRKKWVAFTKEEWVRQNWLNYLIHVQHYPASLMAVEKEIHLGELKKRIDILVYKNSSPWILIECKEQEVPLSEQTIQQILTYQTVIQSGVLIVSNGNDTKAFQITGTQIQQITQLPKFH
ncbi:MAG: type I restriction enzyme HsdR N-terminal domain-containing protein [Sediminibacterium sp.]|uniref:type I restriction enzyme HsdR N-terminal domain-containing protein n=1 Tax=Sediminibacterium sp. TaxID=1917865 RepID=UPI002726258B|nr:type I restriction enzyme HsdR N-terminal domain-containing protein [Sediminibacterium sp.]MDO8997023.1 type I restriction enzyme HsdR N-terminal domain-containing protein [Sediminibacterium sp.]